MKRKELKNLAKKIADAEYIIQNSDDAKAVTKAQDTIIELSGKAMSLEDMMAAILVATIDYRNEVKEDVKVISVKEVK